MRWRSLSVGALVMAVFGVGLWVALRTPAQVASPVLPTAEPRALTPEAGAQFVGGAACGECHAREVTSLRTTSHAQAVRPAKDALFVEMFAEEATLVDPFHGASFTPQLRDGAPGFLVRSGGGKEEFALAVWALGGSNRGYTFLCLDPEGYLTEGRLSYYPGGKGWGFTPGQPNADPTPYAIGRRGVEDLCLPCHSASVVWKEGRLDTAASHLGIGCESCHGPARRHLDLMRQDRNGPLGIARITTAGALGQAEVCGRCHRAPNTKTTDLAGLVSLPRFQGRALSKSACFKRSGGRLTCSTCHDPHADAVRLMADYDVKCLKCHAGRDPAVPSWQPCKLKKKRNCVGCHMPAQDVGMPSQQLFHLHWIK